MKIYVDKMPRSNGDCLFHGVQPGTCQLKGNQLFLPDLHCLLENGECPHLKVHTEKIVNEYPSYFNNCC